MTIRWGLIGCGDVARKRVAEALKQPGCELLAACRRDEGRLAEFCDRFAIPRRYSRDADLISDPDIEAVYLATPVYLHLPQTLVAAAAGKHVMVEKPMALSADECRQMIAACRAAGVKLGVAYYRRFYPLVARMKTLLAAGEIGRPIGVSVVTSTALAMRPGEEGYWRVIPEHGGGGALMDIGSHRLNLLLDLFGPVAEVKALCGTVAADYDAEDCATLALRFQSGVQGSLQCLFGTPVDPDEFSIMGTAGRMLAAPLNGDQLHISSRGQTRVESHAPPANFNAPQVADFAAAIREGREPVVHGEEGLTTTEVIDRAYAEAK